MQPPKYDMPALATQARILRDKVDRLYVYGAGIYAHNIYKFLKESGVQPAGFLVTRKDGQQVLETPLVQADTVIGQNIGIILGLNSHNSRQVLKYLHALNFPAANIIDGGMFLENGSERLGFQGDAIMEITVKIGCPINCRFCPQKNLLKAYYANDKKRPSIMTMETYLKCLAKIPGNVGIVFSGFSEPLTHANSLEMLEIACDQGRKVDLFTTLAGANMAAVKKISRLPINYVGLHCADEYGYAHIPLTEEYYEKVRYLVNCRKTYRDAPFVDICNSQAAPNQRISEICQGKYEICTFLFDRAGNLEGEGLIRKQALKGKLECSMCGSLANRNVLLPDGTVVLCCMDYGLRHPLGNLLHESYEEIQNGREVSLIRLGLGGDESQDILCRQCSCARIVE